MKNRLVKRCLSILLSLVLAVIAMPLTAVGSFAETCGDWDYSVINGNEAEITGYYGSATEIEIPSTLDGYRVTRIGNNTFTHYTSLTSVIIPDSVTSIGHFAFERCESLESVTIDSVASIGFAAFYACISLTSVIMLNGVTSIDAYAFNGCFSLKNVTIPKSVTSIGENAFPPVEGLDDPPDEFKVYYNPNCSYGNITGSITEFILPDEVASIGADMFADYRYLKKITLPAGVTFIDDNAFANCPANLIVYGYTESYAEEHCVENGYNFVALDAGDLADFEYEIGGDKVTITCYYGSDSNLVVPASIAGKWVAEIDDIAFAKSSTLTEVTLPKHLESIGESAFARCSKLESITIPASATSIGNNALANCSANLSVYGYTDSVAEEYCVENSHRFVPLDSTVADFEYVIDGDTVVITAYNGTDSSIIVPASIEGKWVTEIDGAAFANNSLLTDITLPKRIESIGALAFKRCTALESITIKQNITEIDSTAFDNCTSLTTIYGYLDTAAQEYADSHGIDFVYLDIITPGDLDGDGSCELADYAILKGYVSGDGSTLTNYQKIACDVCADKSYDAFDMFYMDKIINGIA